MDFILTIPDEQLKEVTLAVATRNGWTPTMRGTDPDTKEPAEVPNPISAQQILIGAVTLFLAEETGAYRRSLVIAPALDLEIKAG